MESLPQPRDTVDLSHVTINVAGTPLAAQEAVNLHDVSLEQLVRCRLIASIMPTLGQ